MSENTITHRTAMVLALNALHECPVPKGAETQVSDAMRALRAVLDAQAVESRGVSAGWLEAAVAWEVCASLHRQWCKGKDALFSTRQKDFQRHAESARARAKEFDQ